MRLDKIAIPDAGLYLDPASGAYVSRKQHLANVVRAMRDPCIDGYATLYGKLHKTAEGLQVLVPGCFARSLESGRQVTFLFGHQAGNVIGSTRNGLTLADSEEGLAFRMRLKQANPGWAAAIAGRLVATGNRNQMSIGYTPRKAVWREVDGEQVRFIAEADLHEISVLKRGAVSQAFATVVDGAEIPTPSPIAKSRAFAMSESLHRLSVALSGLQDALQRTFH